MAAGIRVDVCESHVCVIVKVNTVHVKISLWVCVHSFSVTVHLLIVDPLFGVFMTTSTIFHYLRCFL